MTPGCRSGPARRHTPVVRVVFALTAAFLGLLAISTSAESSPPHGLSARGRVLWNFEALLHDRFRRGLVCTRDGFNFVGGSCVPLAVWQPYFYLFNTARHSSYVLTTRRPNGSFGQGARLVRISDRYITCTANRRKFLIKYFGAASFTVDCLAPL